LFKIINVPDYHNLPIKALEGMHSGEINLLAGGGHITGEVEYLQVGQFIDPGER
jgi:hypothetical protein